MNTKLKVISFPEAKKKLDRRKFWKDLWNKITSKFHRKVGFEKYVIASWGIYSDTHGVWADIQNKETGKVRRYNVGVQTGHTDVAWKALTLFVSKLK